VPAVPDDPTDTESTIARDPETTGRDAEPDRSAAIDADPFPVGLTSRRVDQQPPQRKPRRKRPARSFWVELPVLVVMALVVAVLIKTFLLQAFFIPSASMRDTLLENDRVMVNKLAYRFGSPAAGQVIVFDSPLEESNHGESIPEAVVRNIGEALGLSTPDSALIKRIVALGGQTVEIREGSLLVDGEPVEEPYLADGLRMSDFGPVTVPGDHVFVMGDNRNQSEDSRRFGSVPESSIIGRAFVRVWPPSRWGGL
jgi:signal peptidase I